MSIDTIIVDNEVIPIRKFIPLTGINKNGNRTPDIPDYFAIGYRGYLYAKKNGEDYIRQGQLWEYGK